MIKSAKAPFYMFFLIYKILHGDFLTIQHGKYKKFASDVSNVWSFKVLKNIVESSLVCAMFLWFIKQRNKK